MSKFSNFLEESSFIRQYLWKYRKLVFWGLFSLFLVDGLEIIPPLILMKTVDTVALGAAESELLKLAALYIGVSIAQAIGRFGWRFFLVRTSMLAGRDLRDTYASHLFGLSSSFYDRKKIGDLMSLATSDVEAVRMAMGGGLVIFADALVYLMTVPIAMIYLSPRLTFLTMIPMLVVPFIVIRNERAIHERFKKVQESFSRLASLAQENLMGIRVIKGFARENAQIHRFLKAGDEYLKLNLDLARVQSAFGPVLDFIMSFGLVLLLYVGGSNVIVGTLTLGTFVAFQRYIQKMIWPMTAVGLSVTFYQRAVTGSNRLKEVLVEQTDVPEPIPPRLPETKTRTARGGWRTPGGIEFRNLNFHYPCSKDPILKNITLAIEPGSRVAFVGSIGSGKSTLLHLIPRLYPVERGMAFVDGVDVNDWSLKDLRDQVGYVSQDTFLFSDTVFENVSLGLFQYYTQQDQKLAVFDATQRAAVHGDILRMDRSYETMLGERGTSVSGGQRQRLTIARALATEPPILILDDALSAVDMQTEEHILSGLRERENRNTEIIAAHRISTVKEADQIFVLERGEIVQAGRHEKLLRDRGSTYWKFYEQQRLEAEVENYVSQLQT